MADEKLAMVLERAGGPVADGDVGEVRRRARSRVRARRRRVRAGIGVAVVVAGLSVAGLGMPGGGDGDDPGVVASGSSAAQPGGLLFERRLDDGSVLRVRSTADASMVAVEVDDEVVVERLPIRQGMVTARPADAAVPWDLATMVPCPGDERRVLRAWTDDGTSDEMSLDAGLAVVAVPPPPALAAGPMRTGEGTLVIGAETLVIGAETMDGSPVEGAASRGFTYVDFLDADGQPVRPATALGTGEAREVVRVPIGSIDHLPAGPIPPLDDPEHPCG